MTTVFLAIAVAHASLGRWLVPLYQRDRTFTVVFSRKTGQLIYRIATAWLFAFAALPAVLTIVVR